MESANYTPEIRQRPSGLPPISTVRATSSRQGAKSLPKAGTVE